MEREYRIGIDIGGTFTDFVIFDPHSGVLKTFKLLSTPANPAKVVLEGLAQIMDAIEASQPSQANSPGIPSKERILLNIIHGSTVATNVLLERKGARTALISTRGFRDVLEIGRQARPALYDLFSDPPPPLVPPSLRLEVDERVASSGQVLTPLARDQIDLLLTVLQSLQVESVAVCLLFSFLQPVHEQRLGDRLRSAGWNVSLSSEILPEFREYERASTTTVNAYVSPIMGRYLGELEKGITGELRLDKNRETHIRLRVMQSNGGHISLGEARQNAVRCILSGPAGGVIGAIRIGELDTGSKIRLLTFDMGGTSTDVSLVDGEPQITSESVVGGCPIGIPVLDIHTIGAGGGSIAYVDSGGALRVGPQSAGANPGPACYALGDPADDQPTVTDANLVLGRMLPDRFLSGRMQLDAERAIRVMSKLGDALGLDPVESALGVIEVINAHMERALRLISVERGYDTSGRDGEGPFTLLSFGGAGGLHAAELARRLGIARVLVPPIASTLSAYGMLVADVVKDYTQTVMLPGNTSLPQIASSLAALMDRGQYDIQEEGIPPKDILIEPSLDMRYVGQSYELAVPWPGFPAGNGGVNLVHELFHSIHHKAYGYSRPGAPLEIVNLRVRAIGRVIPPTISPATIDGPDPSHALIGMNKVWLEARDPASAPYYQYEKLRPGNMIHGLAVIVRADTTIFVGPTDRAFVDPYLNLILTLGPLS